MWFQRRFDPPPPLILEDIGKDDSSTSYLKKIQKWEEEVKKPRRPKRTAWTASNFYAEQEALNEKARRLAVKASTHPLVKSNCVLLPCHFTDSKLEDAIHGYSPDLWSKAVMILAEPIKSTSHFEEVYAQIHSRNSMEVNFPLLHYYAKEHNNLYDIVNDIRNYALELPTMFPNPDSIVYLTSASSNNGSDNEKVVVFSQNQVRCLLALAFFGLLIDQHEARTVTGCEFPFPEHLDFTTIFCRATYGNLARFECILHYFERVATAAGRGGGEGVARNDDVGFKAEPKLRKIEFIRRKLNNNNNNNSTSTSSSGSSSSSTNNNNNLQLWSLSKKLIPKIKVFDESTTESRFTVHFKGHLQTAFCGKKVCCGEPLDQQQQQQQQHSPVGMTEYDEAVFELLRPESLVCRLFVTELTDLESLLIVGTETFCKVTMKNGNFFSYEGDFVEPSTLDDRSSSSSSSSLLVRGCGGGDGRSCMVLMDGLVENIDGGNGDFSKAVIDRELKKAFSCFSRWETIEGSDSGNQSLFPLATGLWQPNNNTDYELRAMIQFLAAAEAGRDQITFYVGKEVVFKEALEEVINGIVVADKMTVGDLYKIMTEELLLTAESPSSKPQQQQQQPRTLFQILKEKKSLLMKSQ